MLKKEVIKHPKYLAFSFVDHQLMMRFCARSCIDDGGLISMRRFQEEVREKKENNWKERRSDESESAKTISGRTRLNLDF